MRTIDEVRSREADPDRRHEDMFGFGTEVLGVYLPELLKEGCAPDPFTEESVRASATSYLQFAFGKALGHRGISADRSVQKLREFAWILGLDEVVAFADDPGNYRNFGVPILKRMALALDVPIPEEIAQWPDGKPCMGYCERGCDQ